MVLDKRLTPARPDLAAAHLKGAVDAARFVEGEKYSIGVGRASLRVAPSDDASQDSELLYGEKITAYERKNGWAWVQAENDKYVGYVEESALGPAFTPELWVCVTMTPVFSGPDIKRPVRDLLPLNAAVNVLSTDGNYLAIAPDAHVYRCHVALPAETETDFVAVAEGFIGVPYVWGGKTFAGLDCSGLIQTSLQAAGIAAPRDTDMQERSLGREVSGEPLQRGDLIFWKGHMGVMLDATNLLHANAFHMQVALEPLNDAVARIEKVAGPVTSVKRL